MREKIFPSALKAVVAILTVTLFAASASAATEKKLHSFGNGRDGVISFGNVVFDTAGNLYGTTYRGGDNDLGTAFELSPDGSGGWTERKLHNFGNGHDGIHPLGGLIFDSAGNLYGTTGEGGNYQHGAVFELAPNGSGGWTETVLYSFGRSDRDGATPYGNLIFDPAGNLYGTTQEGGDHNRGTAFELTPNGSGGWTEKKLHNFGSYSTDGTGPQASLIFDAAGNLYGTTGGGGNFDGGTVFELSPNASGGWTEKKLHNFGGYSADGTEPEASLIFDAAGNLYGTTRGGGSVVRNDNACSNGCGTLFELTPNGNGGWAENKLHNFGPGADGVNPASALIFDAAGNLYGTTLYGGSYPCFTGIGCGTVFELSPRQGGGWTEKKLHSFGINDTDAERPYAGLIFDSAGNLYGTTFSGGNYHHGAVFEVIP